MKTTTLFFLLTVSAFYSCGDEQPATERPERHYEYDIPKIPGENFEGTWRRDNYQKEGKLDIIQKGDEEFDFHILSFAGNRTDEQKGKAKIEGNRATYKAPNGCGLQFVLQGDSVIEVLSIGECINYTSMGEYKKAN